MLNGVVWVALDGVFQGDHFQEGFKAHRFGNAETRGDAPAKPALGRQHLVEIG
ncbi:hypothetical protein SAMN02799626_01875 [Caulobacter sp. UNC279MFTsu5.1]|nr:hypothetical protein SAMN02799626_01875 [Caulobacter sp. UNC279MFTsu5.1]